MSKSKSRPRPEPTVATPFEQARDEMFQHIMNCEVIGSDAEHQAEWFEGTINYLAERYHELGERELKDLRVLGERFAQPPKRAAAQPATSAA